MPSHGMAGGVRVDGTPVSKHRLMTISLITGAVRVEFNATKPHPWHSKTKRRAAGKRARASRKANR